MLQKKNPVIQPNKKALKSRRVSVKKKYVRMMLYVIALFFVTALHCGGIPKTFIAQFLSKNPIVVEAGIAGGEDTEEMAKLWPDGKIFGFEPVPTAYKKAQARLKKYKNISIFNAALGPKTGTMEMHISQQVNGDSWDHSSSLLAPAAAIYDYAPFLAFPKTIMVSTFNLDDWCAAHGINQIDFLWFDLQGIEPEVLISSPKILATVKVIYTEVSLKELYSGQILYPVYKDFLQRNGFTEIYEEYPLGIHGNALFVRSNKNIIVDYK